MKWTILILLALTSVISGCDNDDNSKKNKGEKVLIGGEGKSKTQPVGVPPEGTPYRRDLIQRIAPIKKISVQSWSPALAEGVSYAKFEYYEATYDVAYYATFELGLEGCEQPAFKIGNLPDVAYTEDLFGLLQNTYVEYYNPSSVNEALNPSPIGGGSAQLEITFTTGVQMIFNLKEDAKWAPGKLEILSNAAQWSDFIHQFKKDFAPVASDNTQCASASATKPLS
jgi:hypothetical protein